MRVLLALDGSESSINARDLVAGVPWPTGTAISVVSAYELPIDWTGAVGSSCPGWAMRKTRCAMSLSPSSSG